MKVFLLPPADPTLARVLVETVTKAGHEILSTHEARTPAQAFVAAHDAMLAADALVGDASAPDTDLGWAVAWFLARGRLVVVSCARDAEPGLLVGANPSPWQRLVRYRDADELARAMMAALQA